MILSGRNGVILVALLAILILLINVVTFSYSWFTPSVKNSTGMSYQGSGGVRSQDCSTATFKLTSTNGKLSVGDAVTANAEVAVADGDGIQYFRTVIYNNSSVATNVSLYLASVPTSSAAFSLGVMTPSNSFHTYTTSQTDVSIIRNAYIAGGVTRDAGFEPGVREVIWFIKTQGADVAVDMTQLYILYN